MMSERMKGERRNGWARNSERGTGQKKWNNGAEEWTGGRVDGRKSRRVEERAGGVGVRSAKECFYMVKCIS